MRKKNTLYLHISSYLQGHLLIPDVRDIFCAKTNVGNLGRIWWFLLISNIQDMSHHNFLAALYYNIESSYLQKAKDVFARRKQMLAILAASGAAASLAPAHFLASIGLYTILYHPCSIQPT